MATHRIFFRGDEIVEEQLGLNSHYTYWCGTLHVYNREMLTCVVDVKPGEAFAIKCFNGKVKVERLIPPYKKGALIAWLLGFNKHNRSNNEKEYEEILERERCKNYWEGYIEWETTSVHYAFTRCTRPDMHKSRNVAAFFDDNITKQEVLQLIPFMTYDPEWYVQKILKERFEVTDEEFKKARKLVN